MSLPPKEYPDLGIKQIPREQSEAGKLEARLNQLEKQQSDYALKQKAEREADEIRHKREMVEERIYQVIIGTVSGAAAALLVDFIRELFHL